MTILSLCEWLQNTGWASGIKHSDWKFPLIESIHSLGLAAILWPAVILDLRLLGGVMKRRTVSQVAGQFLPWIWSGFVVMVTTGGILFCAEAVKCYKSPFFRTKLVLLMLTGVNALVFHTGVFKHADTWDHGGATPWKARMAGISSLTLWIGVVAMGRALAYA